MRSSTNRLRLHVLVSLAFVFALALPVWGAERILLPGQLPIGETSQYDMVFFSSRSSLQNINIPGELDSARTNGRLIFSYGNQLIDDQLPFEYGIQDFSYRTASYIAAGIMSANARFSGQLSSAGDVLTVELHPHLFELGLYLEQIFDLTLFIPPTHEVSIGDSWHRSLRTAATNDATAVGPVSVDITYTLQAIDQQAGVAHIAVEVQRTHTDLANDATQQYTIRREANTFGIIEVSLETGHVLSAVAHNRLDVTRIPAYQLAFEGKASIDRLQMLNDIRLERVNDSEK